MLTDYQIIFQLIDNHDVNIEKLGADLKNYCYIFSAEERRNRQLRLKELTFFIETWGSEIICDFAKYYHLDGSSIRDSETKIIKFHTAKKAGNCCTINTFIPFMIFHIGERNIVSFRPSCIPCCKKCEKMCKEFILTDEIKQKMESTRIKKSQHSWGEFYETTKTCDGYSEEEKKKFAIFEALDNAFTRQKIEEIIEPLTEEQINWLNSPCLDGIVFCLKKFHTQGIQRTLAQKEFVETYKYFWNRNLVDFTLTFVASMGFVTLTRFFLENNIDMDRKNEALRGSDNKDIVKLLLEYGADVHNSNDEVLKVTSYKNLETAKFLLENYGPFPQTSLDEALKCSCTKIEAVKLLLEYGADINAYDNYPLICACNSGYPDIVKLMIEKGADIHFENNFPLQWACSNNQTDIVKLLLEKGAVINRQSIFIAITKENTEIVNLLVAYGATIDNTDYKKLQKRLKFLLDIGVKLE